MLLRVRAPMPGDETQPRPGSRGWLLAVLPLAVYGLFVLIEMPLDAQLPIGYVEYPTREVVTCMSIVLIELAFVVGILAARSDTPLGGRAFLLSVLLCLGTMCLAPFAMHADRPIGSTLGWNCVAVLWLFVFALGSGTAAIVRAIRWQVRLWCAGRRRS